MRKWKEDQPLTIAVSAPAGLSPIAKEHWDYVIPKIASNGLLMKGDLKILEMACEIWGLYKAALASGDAAEARKNCDQYIKIMRDFGFTPKSRMSMESTTLKAKAMEKAANPASDFFDEE